MSANSRRQPTGDGDIPSSTGQATSSAGTPAGGATAAVRESGGRRAASGQRDGFPQPLWRCCPSQSWGCSCTTWSRCGQTGPG